jgi:hypothetical protein
MFTFVVEEDSDGFAVKRLLKCLLIILIVERFTVSLEKRLDKLRVVDRA